MQNLFKIVLLLLLTGSGFSSEPRNIRIVYTTNLNGSLDACQCPGENLGGMVRLARAVEILRSKYPDLILLDAGDFFSSYTLPQSNLLMAEFMELQHYDAIGPGDQELVEGLKFLQKVQSRFKLPLLTGNIESGAARLKYTSAHTVLHRKGIDILILNILDKSAFEFIDHDDVRFAETESYLKSVLSRYANKYDLVILLFHSAGAEIADILDQFPEIDILVEGHTQERIYRQADHQVVVQAGMDGEYLGLLDVEMEAGEKNYQNSFITIDKSYGEDPVIRKKVDEYYRLLDEKF